MAPRHVLPFVVPLVLITVGTIGYSLIEAWPIRDSLYMTVITLSTVGFAEVHPLSEEGRTFTVTLVLGGVFALFYVATEGMRAIFGGEVQKLLGRQRMEDHLLVCGFGRMGHLVCEEFSSHGLPFVVMDTDATQLAEFAMPHGIAVTGDATSDDDLKHVVKRTRFSWTRN